MMMESSVSTFHNDGIDFWLRNMLSVKTTATLIAFYENLFIASAFAFATKLDDE